MNIAIIGYGKMGKMIKQRAREHGHKIAAIVEPALSPQASPAGINIFQKIEDLARLDGIDAAVEFTTPAAAAANICALAKMKIPAAAGTTGWHDKLDDVTRAVAAAGSSLIWASNFSIGVNLFYRAAWYAASLFDAFDEFDIGGFESHHNKKLDSPSGTAKVLVDGVLSRSKRKKKVVWEMLNRRPEADELHFPSLRIGSDPGKHSLFFDSPSDTVEITHTARSRESLALGAIHAAQWLADPAKKRQGVFTIDDMLLDMLGI